MTPRTWKWLIAAALVATTAIAVAGQIEIPGVSKFIQPRVECQDSPECREFIRAEIERALRDERHRDFVRPSIRRGGGGPQSVTPDARMAERDPLSRLKFPAVDSPGEGGDDLGPGTGGGQPGGEAPPSETEPSGPGPQPEPSSPSITVEPGADCPVNADLGSVEAEVCLK